MRCAARLFLWRHPASPAFCGPGTGWPLPFLWQGGCHATRHARPPVPKARSRVAMLVATRLRLCNENPVVCAFHHNVAISVIFCEKSQACPRMHWEGSASVSTLHVMPAQAGIQFYRRRRDFGWIPACAGMTFGGFFFTLRHYHWERRCAQCVLICRDVALVWMSRRVAS